MLKLRPLAEACRAQHSQRPSAGHRLRNPPLHFVGGRTWLPDWFLHAAHMIGAAAIRWGLILTASTFL
jgi:hypothetical protein